MLVSVVDVGVLVRLSRDLGDTGLVREIVQLYLDQLGVREESLAHAAAVGDMTTVRREAHTLASASAMVGANDLWQLCKDLETTDADASTIADDPRIHSWRDACQAAATELRAWLRA